MKQSKLVLLYFMLSSFALNAQEIDLPNPLEKFVGEWKFLPANAPDNSDQQIQGYWKVSKMEVGYGIQITVYQALEESSRQASFTLNWVCDPKTGNAYSLNTFPNGRVERREGSIDANGNMKLKSNSVGSEIDIENYNVNTWTFESNDKIHYKRTNYKNGKESGVSAELIMIRIR